MFIAYKDSAINLANVTKFEKREEDGKYEIIFYGMPTSNSNGLIDKWQFDTQGELLQMLIRILHN